MNEYEALKHLARAYLHQDWVDEYDRDPWLAVRDFARGSPDLAPRLRAEVDRILTSGRTEAELRALVRDELDSGYPPEADGWTYRDWLTEVATQVERQLERRGSFTCPVCGYPGLSYEPRTQTGEASREACPSCGFVFGITDDLRGQTYVQWRQRWIDRGMPWASAAHRPPPLGWDAERQFRRLLGRESG